MRQKGEKADLGVQDCDHIVGFYISLGENILPVFESKQRYDLDWENEYCPYCGKKIDELHKG